MWWSPRAQFAAAKRCRWLCAIRDLSRFQGNIPLKELHITYSHSSGPGGQNVNKAESKVELRFHLESAKWIDEPTKNRLRQSKIVNELTKDGYLGVKSEAYRSRKANQANALKKLSDKLDTCLAEVLAQEEKLTVSPEEEERRHKLKLKADRRRIEQKRYRSMIKKYRQL